AKREESGVREGLGLGSEHYATSCATSSALGASTTRSATLTEVPCSLKVPGGRDSYVPPSSSAHGLRVSRCFGPSAQRATSRPPGRKNWNAWRMWATSEALTNGGFITMRSNSPSVGSLTGRERKSTAATCAQRCLGSANASGWEISTATT